MLCAVLLTSYKLQQVTSILDVCQCECTSNAAAKDRVRHSNMPMLFSNVSVASEYREFSGRQMSTDSPTSAIEWQPHMVLLLTSAI
jgi:hypothetical protein